MEVTSSSYSFHIEPTREKVTRSLTVSTSKGESFRPRSFTGVKISVVSSGSHCSTEAVGIPLVKGETSGNVQVIKEIRIDCDDDAVLLKVEQVGGAACHTGHKSCFFKKVENGSVKVVGKPLFDPKEVYRE